MPEGAGLYARNTVRFHQDYCRKLLEHPLHWLIDKPRLLKQVLRVVKRWEPTLTLVTHIPSLYKRHQAGAVGRG